MRIAIAGGGVFGLSAARELARRGHRVELFEADSIPAPKAASHDVSKALRHAYGSKSAFYTPLVAEAISGWRALERESGRTLLRAAGFLALASEFRNGGFEHDSAQELSRLGIAHEVLSRADVARRFPAFARAPCEAALLDPEGGWLDPDSAVLALKESAARAGARIETGSRVADPESLAADAVLVAVGPWLARLLPRLDPPVAPTLQHEWFFRAAGAAHELPVWSYDIATLGYYGFPRLADGTYKVASHCHGVAYDPDLERPPDAADRARAEQFVASTLPFLEPRAAAHRGCLYSNTIDGDFLFDRLPGSKRVFVAGGGSGHAFKFAPLLGRFAADAIEGRPVPGPFRLAAKRRGRTV